MISPLDQGRAGMEGQVAALCEQVVRSARDRLGQSGYGPLRDIHCQYVAGVLTLSGRVPSFYLKQIAQVTVKDVQHVQQIDNQLEVPHCE